MAATGVSRGWREYTGRVWHAAEELCLRILTSSAISLLFALLLHPPLNRKVRTRPYYQIKADVAFIGLSSSKAKVDIAPNNSVYTSFLWLGEAYAT
ncbi:hypothetical protein ZEAMMB73_Zm00001d028184 [Zea mays]|uniref:Uncharacterized protein n=1 Tax=Zea mays TaxID=4577 RepID=A0A1D6JSN8_MAIZE|nr:hypothetical protein ZEAMMB73_Zm00001d028184 [Zea mays]